MIWNPALAEQMNYNPGNQDYVLVTEIEHKVLRAQDEYTPGSASQHDLEMRADAIAYALEELETFDANTPNWWDFYPAPPDTCGKYVPNADAAMRTANGVIVMPSANCTNATKVTRKKMRRRLRLAGVT